MRNLLLRFACPFAVAAIAGCAAPNQPAQTSSGASASGGQTAALAANSQASSGPSMYVPPPVGSLLGGGYVRVAQTPVARNDETGLASAIAALNAAAATEAERPFAVSAISRVSGLSEQQLLGQQDRLRLRFGELLAFNTIARNHEPTVRELVAEKQQGKTWTQLAQSKAVSIGLVAQTVRNADELAANSFSNSSERAKGGQRKLQEMGVHPQVRPGD